MIAAAARTSGTSSPFSSVLKRGAAVSRVREVSIVRARACVAWRVNERCGEYSAFFGAAAGLVFGALGLAAIAGLIAGLTAGAFAAGLAAVAVRGFAATGFGAAGFCVG